MGGLIGQELAVPDAGVGLAASWWDPQRRPLLQPHQQLWSNRVQSRRRCIERLSGSKCSLDHWGPCVQRGAGLHRRGRGYS